MITYQVKKYNWGKEELVIETSNIDEAIIRAELSSKGEWNSRIDTYENDIWVGGSRFFCEGKEITQTLRDSVF